MRRILLLLQAIILTICLAQDPCDNPLGLTQEKTTLPTFYFYTGDDPEMVIIPNEATTDPPGCPIKWSCRQEDFNDINLCEYNTVHTRTSFDSLTGQLTLSTKAPYDFPGSSPTEFKVYIIGILAEFGIHLSLTTYVIVPQDPCYDAPMFRNEPDPFPDLTTHNIDNNSTTSILWQTSTIATLETHADCGLPSVTFFDSLTDQPINPDVFEDVRRDFAPGNFNSFETTVSVVNYEKVGTYQLYYTVEWPLYSKYARSDDFTIDVITFCSEPTSLLTPILDFSQIDYTLTDPEVIVQLPVFTPDPDHCPVYYSYEVSDINAQISIVFDSSVNAFTFYNNYTVAIAGQYTVHVFAASGYITQVEGQVSFELNLINPCEDPSRVELIGLEPDPLPEYFLAKYSESSPYTFDHVEFAVVTSLPSELCGRVRYEAFLDGDLLPFTFAEPMSYVEETRTFSVFTDDLDFVGTKVIEIKASLIDYPQITSTLPFEMSVKSPCDDLSQVTLTIPSQTNPNPYFYSGQILTQTLQPATADPAVCAITYSCAVRENSPRLDLCSVSDSFGTSSFNQDTGVWTFFSENSLVFPQGLYTFEITARVGQSPGLTARTTFQVQLISPCVEYPVVLYETNALPDVKQYLFKPQQSSFFKVENLAYSEAPSFCGDFDISFYLRGPEQEEEQVPTDLLLVLNLPSDDLYDQSKPQELVVSTQNDGRYYGEAVTVHYRVFLVEFPNTYVESSFEISIEIEDECDQRLVINGIQAVLPKDCEPLSLQKRPNVIPPWFLNLSNLSIKMGGSDISYFMGVPESIYGDQMSVSVDFGMLNKDATEFDRGSNTIFVSASKLMANETGYYHIKVDASYIEIDGDLISYERTLYLFVQAQDPTFIPPVDFNQGSITEITEEPKEIELPEYISQAEAEVKKQAKGPMPYVSYLSWTGELGIKWDSQMLVPSDPAVIPQEKIFIEESAFDSFGQNDGSRFRLLQEELNTAVIIEADAIQIELVQQVEEDQNDGQVNQQLTWYVVEYKEDELILQINFEDPTTVSDVSTTDYDTIRLTFWGTNYFQDTQSREIQLGTQINWRTFRQVQVSEAEEAEQISSGTSVVLYIIGLLFLALAFTCGPLLPLWMFFNSLQLIAHLPLLRISLPATANIILLDYLSIVRLHVGALNEAIESMFGLDDDKRDYEAVIDEDSSYYYNELLMSCDYHASLARNLILIALLFLVIVILWLFVALRDNFFCKVREQRQNETWWNNFFVRFLYEVFFELALCLMISLSMSGAISSFEMAVCCMLAVASIAVICILTVMCFKGGPYVAHSYERHSLRKSFWHMRGIKGSVVLDFFKSKKELQKLQIENQKDSQDPFEVSAHGKAQRDQTSEGNFKELDKNKDIFDVGDKLLVQPLGRDANAAHGFIDVIEEEDDQDSSGQPRAIDLENQNFRPMSNNGSLEPSSGSTAKRQIGKIQNSSNNQSATQMITPIKERLHKSKNHDRSDITDEIILQEHSAANFSESIKVPIDEDQAQLDKFLANQQIMQASDQSRYEDGEEARSRDSRLIQLNDVLQLQNTNAESRDMYEGGEQIAKKDVENLRQGDASASESDDLSDSFCEETKRKLNKQPLMRTKYVVDTTKLAQLVVQAHVKLVLEGQVISNPRYKTVFEGLKKNHAHNVALVHPLAFLLRRIVFSAIIVFMYSMPYAASLILLLLTMAMLAYVITEQQWETSLINKQHIANEIALYVCLVIVFYFSNASLTKQQSSILGWALIVTVLITIALNSAIIVYMAIGFFKMKLRHRFVQTQRAKNGGSSKNKVVPVNFDGHENEANVDFQNDEELPCPTQRKLLSNDEALVEHYSNRATPQDAKRQLIEEEEKGEKVLLEQLASGQQPKGQEFIAFNQIDPSTLNNTAVSQIGTLVDSVAQEHLPDDTCEPSIIDFEASKPRDKEEDGKDAQEVKISPLAKTLTEAKAREQLLDEPCSAGVPADESQKDDAMAQKEGKRSQPEAMMAASAKPESQLDSQHIDIKNENNQEEDQDDDEVDEGCDASIGDEGSGADKVLATQIGKEAVAAPEEQKHHLGQRFNKEFEVGGQLGITQPEVAFAVDSQGTGSVQGLEIDGFTTGNQDLFKVQKSEDEDALGFENHQVAGSSVTNSKFHRDVNKSSDLKELEFGGARTPISSSMNRDQASIDQELQSMNSFPSPFVQKLGAANATHHGSLVNSIPESKHESMERSPDEAHSAQELSSRRRGEQKKQEQVAFGVPKKLKAGPKFVKQRKPNFFQPPAGDSAGDRKGSPSRRSVSIKSISSSGVVSPVRKKKNKKGKVKKRQ